MRRDKTEFCWERVSCITWQYSCGNVICASIRKMDDELYTWQVYVNPFENDSFLYSEYNSLPFQTAKDTCEQLLYQYGVIY
jgi:hypothetical protein